jgi:hypothetical protein
VSEPPERAPQPQVGALSPDGSRMWNGTFWVMQQPSRQAQPQPPAYGARPVVAPLPEDRGGFRTGLVVLAALVGIVLGHLHFTVPGLGGTLDSALLEIAVVNAVWGLFTYGSVVVILSIGRQGFDILLLRAAVVAFALGAAYLGGSLFLVGSRLASVLAVLVIALLWTALGGPVLWALALLANLLWYRSPSSLRPQLRIFNRAR